MKLDVDRALADLGSIPDPLAGPATTIVAPPRRETSAAPTRADVGRGRWLALGVTLAWVGVHLAVYGVRGDLARLGPSFVALWCGAPLALALVALGVALAPGRSLGLGARATLLLAVVAPTLFLLLLGGASPWHGDRGSDFLVGVGVCLDITLSVTLPPLLVAGLALRRAFAAGARWRSALVGAAAGLVAGTFINAHCPAVDPWHNVFGHGLPVLVSTLIGALVLERWTRS